MSDVEVKIRFNSDDIDGSDFTWGDMEDLQAGKYEILRRMVERYGTIEGIPEEVPEHFRATWLTNYLRGLPVPNMLGITNKLLEVINEKQNPSKNGKNSGGALPNTSTPKRVRRR